MLDEYTALAITETKKKGAFRTATWAGKVTPNITATNKATSESGRCPAGVVKRVAYDTPVADYGVGMTNLFRLWKSETVEFF